MGANGQGIGAKGGRNHGTPAISRLIRGMSSFLIGTKRGRNRIGEFVRYCQSRAFDLGPLTEPDYMARWV